MDVPSSERLVEVILLRQLDLMIEQLAHPHLSNVDTRGLVTSPGLVPCSWSATVWCEAPAAAILSSSAEST